MRDTILKELQAIYAHDPDTTNTYSYDVNSWLAGRLEEYLTNGANYGTFHLPPNRREVINMIWMNWSGGGTAEIAAKRILEALDIQLPEDEA